MNALAPVNQAPSLVQKFATKYSVDSTKLLTTLKATAFKTRGEPASNEQMMALLIVADQYSLNPFTKEIFAFEDKQKGIVPVVSVDGWTRIINEHPQYDGCEFTYSENIVEMARGKPCPEWCEARFYRKDRTRPLVVREYLDEVYQPPRGQNGGFDGPWQTHTKRFLRHKAYIQGARLAFGFAGIYDEDEASRIIDGVSARVEVIETKREAIDHFQASLEQRAAIPATPGDVVDMSTGEILHSTSDAEPQVGASTFAPMTISDLRESLRAAKTASELNALWPYVTDIPDDAVRDNVMGLFDQCAAAVCAAISLGR